MEQRDIGASGLRVSTIGLGCNNFGWLIDAQTSDKVIFKALDLGINFFDTADMYGESEVVLGKALASHRKDVVIATKFGMAGEGVVGGASRSYVMQATERSLRRLNTSYIDVLYLHRPDPTVPMDETLGALEDLIRQGKVRHAAASNMTPELLEEARTIATSKHLTGFVATQERYSLLVRGIERTLVPVVESLGMALIPYFPLASGLLTGKYRRGVAPAEGTRLGAWKQLSSLLLTEENFDTLDRLEAFARERGHTVGELAIAWLLGKSYVPSVIAGATQAAQLESNVAAVAWKLPPQDVAEVERLAPAAH
jgi:aryl-alcohol dehydrogenase-like predicted oxidoreductase